MNMTGTFIATLEPLGPFKFECKPYVLALSPIKIPKADRKLVAWWKFDEAEGSSAADSSGNNIIGTVSGNPQWQPYDPLPQAVHREDQPRLRQCISLGLHVRGQRGYIEIQSCPEEERYRAFCDRNFIPK